jgi:hypothetical protein
MGQTEKAERQRQAPKLSSMLLISLQELNDHRLVQAPTAALHKLFEVMLKLDDHPVQHIGALFFQLQPPKYGLSG